ncbi:MAG: PA14 domain-containing protein [Pseudomonadota bacterium]|nr:PA14 domain-containing protein [Pseudomonadota bacterium]
MMRLNWSLVPAAAALVLLSGCGAAHKDDRAFGTKTYVKNGLRGEFYPLKKGASRLPDFAALHTHGSFFTPNLNATPRSTADGIVGVTDLNEWFAFDYKAAMTVAQAGTYGFRTVSDDGSRLLVDGHTVVDNDGVHAPASASGSFNLMPGVHQLEVQYFKGPHWWGALQVYCTAPGGPEGLLPACGGMSLEAPRKLSDNFWWMWLGGLLVVAGGWWLLRGRKTAG